MVKICALCTRSGLVAWKDASLLSSSDPILAELRTARPIHYPVLDDDQFALPVFVTAPNLELCYAFECCIECQPIQACGRKKEQGRLLHLAIKCHEGIVLIYCYRNNHQRKPTHEAYKLLLCPLW
jgi:hypothetical protein